MKTFLSVVFISCTMLLFSEQQLNKTKCACKECRCTQEAHCGCFSEKGCACTEGSSCKSGSN